MQILLPHKTKKMVLLNTGSKSTSGVSMYKLNGEAFERVAIGNCSSNSLLELIIAGHQT